MMCRTRYNSPPQQSLINFPQAWRDLHTGNGKQLYFFLTINSINISWAILMSLFRTEWSTTIRVHLNKSVKISGRKCAFPTQTLKGFIDVSLVYVVIVILSIWKTWPWSVILFLQQIGNIEEASIIPTNLKILTFQKDRYFFNFYGCPCIDILWVNDNFSHQKLGCSKIKKSLNSHNIRTPWPIGLKFSEMSLGPVISKNLRKIWRHQEQMLNIELGWNDYKFVAFEETWFSSRKAM